jgi:hypothetical protein
MTKTNKRNKPVKENLIQQALGQSKNKDLVKTKKSKRGKPQSENLKRTKSELGLIVGNFRGLNHILAVLFESVINGLKILQETSTSIIRLLEPSYLSDAIANHISVHNALIKEHGIEYGTKRYKTLVNYSISLMEGVNVPFPNEFQMAVGKVDKWPNIFGHLRPLFHIVMRKDSLSHYADQLMRTIFGIPRMVQDFSEIDVSSITKSGKDISEFRIGFRKFLKTRIGTPTWKGSIPKIWSVKPSLSNNTKGPNGKNKWEDLQLEAKLLADSPLFKHFTRLCNAVGAEKLLTMVNKINLNGPDKSTLIKNRKWKSSPTIRKIMAVPDSGNKSRSIAIADIFTQTLLAPLEQAILNLIRLNFSDTCNVFDHHGGFKKLRIALRAGVQSLDASNWTDRLPALLQKDLLTQLLGSEISDSWYELVVKCDWTVHGTTTTIKYAVGQGMGIHASFAIATLTDLFLIEYAYSQFYPELYRKMRSDSAFRQNLYNKIGDDLWCFDPDKHFIRFYEGIGVDINLSKSKFADESNLVAEYVSRNINRAYDVSRISAQLVRKAEHNIYIMPVLYDHLTQRLPMEKVSSIFRAYITHGLFKKKFLWEQLACMCILEKAVFGSESYITPCGELVLSLLKDLHPESYDKVVALKTSIERKPLEFSYGLLLKLIKKEWSSIENHLLRLKDDLAQDRIRYYERTLPIDEGSYFAEKLYEEPANYIENVRYGKAVFIKNNKLNPFIFKGVEVGSIENSLPELREILYNFEEFSSMFLILDNVEPGSTNHRLRTHFLQSSYKLLVYNPTDKLFEPTVLEQEFENEIPLLTGESPV